MNMQATWPGWETVRLIGRGSFGAVYEIQRGVYGDVEKCALKHISIPQSEREIREMKGEGMDDESITQSFADQVKDIVQEYKMMARLRDCPNVVTCHDVEWIQKDEGFGWDIYIRMELLTPFVDVLSEKQKVAEEEAVRLGKDICTALAACRRLNIIHRDIKPQNIFVSQSGIYKLGDFGIARIAERTGSATARIGTYTYMAPEVYHGEHYGAGADLYSLGLVLYWLLNERRGPFVKVNTLSEKDTALRRRMSGEAIPAPAHGSAELQRIVLKACAFDPAERYQSAEEMLADLERLGKADDPTAEPEEDTVGTRTVYQTAGAARRRSVEDKSVCAYSGRSPNERKPESARPARPGGAETGKPRRKGGIIGLITAVLALAAVLLFVLFPRVGSPSEKERDSEEAEVCRHSWTEATCTAPRTCKLCGATRGAALGHSWAAATCTAPRTCTLCGATEGTALGHSWAAATYTAPKTCTLCGATEGEPLPQPTPEPLTASVTQSFSHTGTRIEPSYAEASSYINSNHIGERGVIVRYASCAIDGDAATSWQEAATGYGINQWITVYFQDTETIRYFTFLLGNCYSKAFYDENGRPSELRIDFSDGSSVTCQFPDVMTEHQVSLSAPVTASWVKVTILGAYSGSKYEDTCISEIGIYS